MKIKMPSIKKKTWVIVLVAIVILVMISVASQGGKAMEVDGLKVTKGDVVSILEETATVKTHTERVVSSMVTAQVKDINISIGAPVKKGDPLIELDILDVEFQISTLRAQIKSLQALLADYSNVEPETIEQSLAQIRSAEASLSDADRELASSEKLYEVGAISQDAYERAVNDQIIKTETLEALKQSHELTKRGISSDLKRKYSADIEAIGHQIEQLENAKSKHSIVSPIDGIVTDKYVNLGDLLVPGTEIVEIVDDKALYLETDVLASDMKLIEKDTPVVVDDEDLNLLLDAMVTKVYPKAFSKTSDLGIEQKRVKLELGLKETGQLKLGYEVDVDIIEELKEDVISIPDSSVFKINRQWHVFVVEGDKAVLRPVEVGLKGRDNFEIVSGLEVGEIVIDSPDNELDEGMSVVLMEKQLE